MKPFLLVIFISLCTPVCGQDLITEWTHRLEAFDPVYRQILQEKNSALLGASLTNGEYLPSLKLSSSLNQTSDSALAQIGLNLTQKLPGQGTLSLSATQGLGYSENLSSGHSVSGSGSASFSQPLALIAHVPFEDTALRFRNQNLAVIDVHLSYEVQLKNRLLHVLTDWGHLLAGKERQVIQKQKWDRNLQLSAVLKSQFESGAISATDWAQKRLDFALEAKTYWETEKQLLELEWGFEGLFPFESLPVVPLETWVSELQKVAQSQPLGLDQLGQKVAQDGFSQREENLLRDEINRWPSLNLSFQWQPPPLHSRSELVDSLAQFWNTIPNGSWSAGVSLSWPLLLWDPLYQLSAQSVYKLSSLKEEMAESTQQFQKKAQLKARMEGLRQLNLIQAQSRFDQETNFLEVSKAKLVQRQISELDHQLQVLVTALAKNDLLLIELDNCLQNWAE